MINSSQMIGIRGRNLRLPLLLILLLVGGFSLLPQAGQTTLKQTHKPDNQGAPDGRIDGTTRDPSIKSRLISLTPLGRPAATLASHPTFWAHVPADQGWVMLRLQDAESEAPLGAIAAFPVSNGPGLMNVQWPESMPALEPDRLYRWTLIYCCSENLVRSQLAVSGTVIRRSPDSLDLTGREEDPLAWSIQQGLWLDAIAIAAAQRRSDRDRTAAQWQALLTHPDMALSVVIDAPINTPH